MPSCIKRSVQQQNIRFLHTRSQYTEEYFKFIRNIATINAPNIVASSNDLQVQIVSKLKNEIKPSDNTMNFVGLISTWCGRFLTVFNWFCKSV